MRPVKFFNFVMPYETYQELKQISIESEKPIAEIVRSGIDHLLKGKANDGQAKNTK